MAFKKLFLLFFIPIVLYALKPNLLLLKVYKDQNISDWVMSEKLDGIRAYWNGKYLMSRSGKIIHAPKWFLKKYPPFAIDGELWTKRGDFEHIISIVQDKVPTQEWKEIKHYIFEVPHVNGNLFTRLEKVKPYENEVIHIIPQYYIKNKQQMLLFLHKIESLGGEGIVVRDPFAPYIAKRTAKALKVKSFLDDECEVIRIIEGKGKYRGLMGSLQCKLRNGTLFKIGSGFTDEERKNPPIKNDIITFKYKELTKYKKPRFPIFLRVRYTNKNNFKRDSNDFNDR